MMNASKGLYWLNPVERVPGHIKDFLTSHYQEAWTIRRFAEQSVKELYSYVVFTVPDLSPVGKFQTAELAAGVGNRLCYSLAFKEDEELDKPLQHDTIWDAMKSRDKQNVEAFNATSGKTLAGDSVRAKGDEASFDGFEEGPVDEDGLVILKTIDDYVDKKIKFIHDDAQWCMMFSEDYQQVTKANSTPFTDDIGIKTVWSYTPPAKYRPWPAERMQPLQEDYKRWLVLDEVDENFLTFAVGCARVFLPFPELSMEQLCFAQRHYTSTFIMDDPLESSCRVGMSETFGKAYLNNLRYILTENSEGKYTETDLRDIIPLPSVIKERYTQMQNQARVAQIALRSLTQMGKAVLSPEQFKLHQNHVMFWFDALEMEAPAYQKHSKHLTYPTFEELRSTRPLTVGFALVSVPIFRPSPFYMLPVRDEFLLQGALVVAIDNDLVGVSKEADKNFSPSNFTMVLVADSGMVYSEGARRTTIVRNEVLKELETILESMDEEDPKYFVYLAIFKYVISIGDYEYILGDGYPNNRYKWYWEKCE